MISSFILPGSTDALLCKLIIIFLNSSKFIIPSPLASNSSISYSHSSSGVYSISSLAPALILTPFDRICFSSLGVIYPFWSRSNKLKASKRFFSVSILFTLEHAVINSENSIYPLPLKSTFFIMLSNSSSKRIFSPKYSLNPNFSSSTVRMPSWF